MYISDQIGESRGLYGRFRRALPLLSDATRRFMISRQIAHGNLLGWSDLVYSED